MTFAPDVNFFFQGCEDDYGVNVHERAAAFRAYALYMHTLSNVPEDLLDQFYGDRETFDDDPDKLALFHPFHPKDTELYTRLTSRMLLMLADLKLSEEQAAGEDDE